MNRNITRFAIAAVLAVLLVAVALRLFFTPKEEGCNQRDDSCAVGCP
jgi:hypothetical protein